MPQASEELRDAWGISEAKAEAYLFWHGWVLTKNWQWWHPYLDKAIMDDLACDAISFLIQEWDYGGLAPGHAGKIQRYNLEV